ncbi:MAG: EAL domain-containing protein [Eubacteriales bacterium]|nr:EAL domain-containing protein [Eubacteriales bacterium]
MGDLLYFQNYSSLADISTMALCILIFILLVSVYISKHRNLIVFMCGTGILFISAAASVFFHTFILRITEYTIPLIYITRAVYYIGLAVDLVLFCVYISKIIKLSGKTRIVFDYVISIIFILFAVYTIATPFVKGEFYIDENLEVHQNYYFMMFRWMYIFFVSLLLSMIVIYRRKFVTKVFRCMISVFGLAVLMMLIQSFYMSTSYTCITFMLPIIMVLFLYHYNAYDNDTGMLDSKAFNGYVKENSNRDLSFIFLYLQDMNDIKVRNLSDDFFHFNEQFFKDPYVFRLDNEHFVMIYRRDKNPDGKKKIPDVFESFYKLYDLHRVKYKIITMDSNPLFITADDYMIFKGFIEDGMDINSVYSCSKDDFDKYVKTRFILNELKDIHILQDPDDERIKVFCQPVLNVKTGELNSAEALMRLELPKYGMIYPDQFIYIAEKYDYIHSLSKIILNKTCKEIKRITDAGYSLERVSVNFSMQELSNPDFCDDVKTIIKNNDISYSLIAVELTESRNENDFENVKNVMRNLRKLGIKFYLDDFGTGYSNIERITALPIDIIKFDRSLTIMSGQDDKNRFIVGSFSDIFKESDYQVLFEGVEDEEDETRCIEMNASYLQGYKYSTPVPISELKSFLRKM